MTCLLVVRLRGTINVPHWAEMTLRLLNLDKRYTATLVTDTPSVRGMLKKVKDYVAWSPAEAELIKELLEKRGKVSRRKRLTLEEVRKLGFEDFASLAASLAEGKISLNKLSLIKPFFTLHPPRGGFPASSRRLYRDGVLGENPELPKLVSKML
ncbi:MAG: 50S ribosomal protein L30 [Thaumarchaeota archaeon]|jgi:large subunit ribosomal protein L30|nr:50S ribosomal protein L30 [Nitrososphaerota archaeon]